jgi:hypothetical protein
VTQGELFDIPGHPSKPARAMTVPGTRLRYAPWRFKNRRLCDDCIADIHRIGVALAPLPLTVRWRRTEYVGDPRRLERPDVRHTYLCDRHRIQRQESEQ